MRTGTVLFLLLLLCLFCGGVFGSIHTLWIQNYILRKFYYVENYTFANIIKYENIHCSIVCNGKKWGRKSKSLALGNCLNILLLISGMECCETSKICISLCNNMELFKNIMWSWYSKCSLLVTLCNKIYEWTYLFEYT